MVVPVNRDLQFARAIGEIRGLCEETHARLEGVENEMRRMQGAVTSLDDFLRQELLSGGLAPKSTRSPSMPAKALKVGGKWGACGSVILLAILQIASAFRPDLSGPLQSLIQLFGGP